MTSDQFATWLDGLSDEALYGRCVHVMKANVGRREKTPEFWSVHMECGRRQPDGPALWRRAEEAVRRESDARRAGNEEALRRRLGGRGTCK